MRDTGAMMRLRQVALAAHDLDATVNALCETFALTVCHRDPGVAEFGLVNALMVIGDQFIEVVAPTNPATTAGRLLDKRCPSTGLDPAARRVDGVTGYMAIYEVDDLDEREQHVLEHGVRIVWRGDFATIRGRHLHPADVGGAIVSIDQPRPQGSWAWAGTEWVPHRDNAVVTSIAGVVVGAHDPMVMRARWSDLGVDHAVRFQTARQPTGSPTDGPTEGIDEVELTAADRSRCGEEHTIGGVLFRLV